MASQADDDDLYLHAEAVKKVTALYANRIFAQPMAEGMVRVSFGEMSDTFDPSYHSAIALTPELALEFADVVQRVAARVMKHRDELAEALRSQRLQEDFLADIAAKNAAGKPNG